MGSRIKAFIFLTGAILIGSVVFSQTAPPKAAKTAQAAQLNQLQRNAIQFYIQKNKKAKNPFPKQEFDPAMKKVVTERIKKMEPLIKEVELELAQIEMKSASQLSQGELLAIHKKKMTNIKESGNIYRDKGFAFQVQTDARQDCCRAARSKKDAIEILKKIREDMQKNGLTPTNRSGMRRRGMGMGMR